ncbi:MAG: DUF4301 family protein [Bacteroidetes bacterium]|nr:DUF4301 family protein [Bacteroidota bacterium]
MFTSRDIEQIRQRGISMEAIEYQLEKFVKGFPFVNLAKPATVPDGILRFTEEEANALSSFFEENSGKYRIIKFVPASGAASRMFKHLFAILEWYKGAEEDKMKLRSDQSFNSVYYFLNHLDQFAFLPELDEVMQKNGLSLKQCIENEDYATIISFLIEETGLNYGNLPKGLLAFHNYEGHYRTPIKEHMMEGIQYSRDPQGIVRIHFTLSPEHVDKFLTHTALAVKQFESLFPVRFELSYSIQKTSTDTLAVDMDNNPFREPDGSLVFRPGGHGALIENLNDLKEDIIFIKNIDNVVPDKYKEQTYLYKKALVGLLIRYQQKIFESLLILEIEATDNQIDDIARLASDELFVDLGDAYPTFTSTEKKAFLFHKLNRPIRLCGMVKNEGEPGGGPFWLRAGDGNLSLQVVESSQVDLQDEAQQAVFAAATHFNPVDLVCGTHNYKGEKFDLRKYIDQETGFISIKSKDGQRLKAQELPGLWNGAMADWITVFVEVPLITFNPVKVINDLLRETHR